MRRTLRALLVSEADDAAPRIAEELARGAYDTQIVRVADAASLKAQLSPAARWDVVLADERASVSALDALSLVRRHSEETALVVVRPEADGCRLIAAVERAVHESRLRAEQREVREQLVVAERLASVGFLVAGIAHEINNPLSAVIANQEFVRAEIGRLEKAGHDVRDTLAALDDAVLATMLIRQVVRELRTFTAHDAGDEVEVVDARALLDGALRMTWYGLRERARLVRDLGACPLVLANGPRLSQAFLNLLLNAVQAIPPGQAAKHEIRVVTSTDAHGNFVAEIHDTGMGIASEHVPHIFDAFFTTKPPGEGTGLGLAITHRVIEQLGGRIEVASVIGKGSQFTITLPPVEKVEKGDS
jgi:signal transduction histidine kinase